MKWHKTLPAQVLFLQKRIKGRQNLASEGRRFHSSARIGIVPAFACWFISG
jgi:hypothetical protein